MCSAYYAAPSDRAEAVGARPLRILVADDHRDTVLTLMVLLREIGYEIRGVYDGAQVLEAVGEFEPDVVLLDIGMPNVDGYEAARVIRVRYGDEYPVLIAITAYAKPTDKMLAKMAGFDHHFGKPIHPDVLINLIATIRPQHA
jgi:CheY-like chemotaxis protein